MDIVTNIKRSRQTGGLRDTQTHTSRSRQTVGLIDRQTRTQTDKHTRQAEKHKAEQTNKNQT